MLSIRPESEVLLARFHALASLQLSSDETLSDCPRGSECPTPESARSSPPSHCDHRNFLFTMASQDDDAGHGRAFCRKAYNKRATFIRACDKNARHDVVTPASLTIQPSKRCTRHPAAHELETAITALCYEELLRTGILPPIPSEFVLTWPTV